MKRRRSDDELIRAGLAHLGVQIWERPNHGPAVWQLRDGRRLTQEQAIELMKREQDFQTATTGTT